MITIACQQLSPAVGRREDNARMAESAIGGALEAGANIIVLPELVLSGYVFESAAEVRSLAIPGTSESFASWSRLVAPSDALVAGGFVELGADGLLYNSVALVGGEGLLALYRKTHLWDEEKRWFTPGAEVPPVVATRFASLGLLVCYDLEFPETSRHLALRGAEAILVPTNWPRSKRPEGERPGEMGNAMVAARLNRVYLACCDRVGTERGVEWTGGSCVVDPDGWVLAERPDRDEGLIVADVELAEARDKWLNKNNHVLADRRPELYSSLVEPAAGAPSD